ncbi:MAG: fibronectin type III domain-containing protein [Bacteroidia bacterium]
MKKLLLLPLLCVLGIAKAQTYDSLEYATGTKSAQQQLMSYPLPRYKPGHTLNRNFIWFGLNYFSGAQQTGVNNQQMISTAKVNAVEFHNNWNYYFMVNDNIGSYSTAANYADTTNILSAALTAVAKRNPQFKTSAICFWAQIGGNITNDNLASTHYIKNASGQYLDLNGATTTNKYWSPVAPAASIIADGQKQRTAFLNLTTALGRPLDILNENGEVIPLIEISGGAVTNDPNISADKASSGYSSVNDYRSSKYVYQTKLYRDQFMGVSPTTKFTHYALDGQIDYRPLWSFSRDINSPINGRYYPTGDFYPRWPNNWRAWAGAWHGLGWFADCKYYEMLRGDSLMSPFVSAGWNVDETQNMRPAQYLATLKILSGWGSEFFYSGYFSLSAPWPNSMNWGWQTVMPVYAQAITSRYEEFLRNGILLNGDVPRYYLSSTTLSPNNPKYLFNTGDNRQLVTVRQLKGSNKYVITTAQMVDANTVGNAPMTSYGKFKLGNDSLWVEFRRQGSVYIYDATNPNEKVFYQLDGWHQYEHPERWSSDFNIEAELYDNANSSASIKTERPNGTAAGDYRTYTSYVSFASGTPPSLEYNFTPRNTSTYYLWVRVRSKNATGGSVSVTLNGQNAKSIGCITSTAWQWLSLDACSGQAIRFAGMTSQQNQVLSLLLSNSNIEVDKILLTTNAGLNLNASQAACGATVATISTSGSTSFCQGGSVTLTAQSGTSYAWSSGQTTQSISVSTSGNYSVTVNNGSGCAAVSNPVAVTVNAAPVATITSSGPLAICQGQNVTLSTSGGTAYVWSNGATTSSINVSTAGNYAVTVTGTGGCTAVSAPSVVSITSSPSTTISASGATTFCQGSSVTLTAPAGYNYVWSNGSTARSINVTTSGNYAVTVSSTGGCSGTSAPTAVTVNSNPSATITASGATSFCQGGSVTLTAGGGSTYVWSNGQTGNSLSVNASGSYTVTATNQYGCTGTSAAKTVTVNPLPTASIAASGNTNLVTGQSVTLTATGGSSYLWQPGGQTTTSITVNTPGNYYAIVSSAAGCTATTNTITVSQASSSTPVDITTSAVSVCQGSSATLSATGGSNYLWAPGGQTTASISVNQSGTYIVYSRDLQGNILSTDSAVVTVKPTPMKPSISITYIPNAAYQLTAYEPSAVRYTWSTGSSQGTINVAQAQSVSVTATNAFGCTSGSTAMTVGSVTAASCIKPNMLTAYNISDTTAVLQWNPAITGERFNVRYWPNGSTNVTLTQIAGTLSSLRIRNLQPGTTYNWTVENVCAAGTYMSSTETFSTLATPLNCGSTPQHLRTDNIGVAKASVKWYNTTADSFAVRYREAGATAFSYLTVTGLAGSTGTDLLNLKRNTTYEWQVNSTCSGFTSPYSTSEFFTTLDTCGQIRNIGVSDIQYTSALLRWTNNATMDTIRIRITNTLNGTQRTPFVNSTSVNGTYQINGLRPNTTYTVEIRGKCNGRAGAWSSPLTFTTINTNARVTEQNPLGLVAFPNPVSDLLTLTFESDDDASYVVKVCDMTGRELMQEVKTSYSGTNVTEVPVNTYAKGAYLLILQKGTQRSQFRFTVQ